VDLDSIPDASTAMLTGPFDLTSESPRSTLIPFTLLFIV
jgi:hypothetical protein